MKKYKIICFCIVAFILLLFIPPLIEGFDECIIDTLVNLKMDVAQIKEELKIKMVKFLKEEYKMDIMSAILEKM